MRKFKSKRRVRQSTFSSSSSISGYEYFVIFAKRNDSRTVSVTVYASPAGKMPRAQESTFPAEEAEELRASFLAGIFVSSGTRTGRMMLTQAEATAIGKRLARVLFPGEVFRLLAESLAAVARSNLGLRIRLGLEESLLDLPWEYVYRPDRLQHDGMSGFLLLDPLISMVRHADEGRIYIEPITGHQRLDFVGTLWQGNEDRWEVRKEFDLLSQALEPVRRYILPEFAVANSAEGLGATRQERAAIFHYAGHCDFDAGHRAFLLRELPTSRALSVEDIFYVDELAPSLARSGTRLAVMSACNSGYWAAVKPLLNAGIPAVLGVNGAVNSRSTIEFCAKLYEALAVGLTLDEAVGRARMHLMRWGRGLGLFDWGLFMVHMPSFMVHMPSPEATLFPRVATPGIVSHQESIRQDYAETIVNTLTLAKEIDGMNFGEIMSELSKRRVLILGRFTGRRLEVLKGIQAHLEKHSHQYQPELFTYPKPESRDLVETIIGAAALSRFIIADLSDPKSVQAELEAIVPHFQSVPVVPVINRTGKEYATFSSVQRRENVVKPTVRYRDLGDLIKKLDELVVPMAERKLEEVKPAGRA
jgi:hypothetical protein